MARLTIAFEMSHSKLKLNAKIKGILLLELIPLLPTLYFFI